MRRVSLLSTLCILASLLVSGPLTTGAPALASLDSPRRTTIQGVFTDAVTGTPVADACISLYRPAPPLGFNHNHRMARACSDANGFYSLPNIPAGSSHYAYLEAPGYGAQWYPGSVDSGTLSFFATTAPVTTRNIALKRATAGLAMHLNRQDGSPAPYASINVVNYPVSSSVAVLRTDANGDASRTDIPAGSYKIIWGGAGYTGAVYYPGKSNLDDGEVVTLKAGSTLSLSDQFPPVDPMPPLPVVPTLSGFVRTPDGTPIAGATVTAKAASSETVYGSTSTDSNGAYTMEVRIGTTGFVQVSAPGYATVWNIDDPLPATPIPLTSPRDVVLRPGSGTIRGTLTDSVPGPIPAMTSMKVLGPDGWAYTVEYVGYDGTFEIPNVPPGTYTLSFTPPGRQSQQIENVVVRDGEVTTADAQLLDPGRIRARVIDDVTGQPIAGATVKATGSPVRTATTDAQGYAELTDYGTADTVQVSATHKPYHFEPVPEIVHPAPGTVTEVTLRMRLGAALTVPVGNVNPAYRICADLIDMKSWWDSWWSGNCELPANGVVTFGPLEPGTYRAFLRPTNLLVAGAQWVSGSGGTGEERSATVLRLTAGSTTAAPEQHLGPAGSITGRSTDPNTHEILYGCVRFASHRPFADMGGCTDSSGAYRIDGLGPYAWPLFFDSGGDGVRGGPDHGSIWSGGATSRLDAELVQVTGATVATYDFAPGAAAWFDVQPPAGSDPGSWSVGAYDPQTGDYVGHQDPSWSTVSRGPMLLQIGYSLGDGTAVSCWMQRQANLRGGRPNGIYYGGTWEHQTRITVVPGKNCLTTMPPIIRITPAPGNLKPLNPNQPATPRQAVSISGRTDVAGAPSITTTEPETFNDFVQSSFDSALQLALGALP